MRKVIIAGVAAAASLVGAVSAANADYRVPLDTRASGAGDPTRTPVTEITKAASVESRRPPACQLDSPSLGDPRENCLKDCAMQLAVP
jgi:hypothetical protein